MSRLTPPHITNTRSFKVQTNTNKRAPPFPRTPAPSWKYEKELGVFNKQLFKCGWMFWTDGPDGGVGWGGGVVLRFRLNTEFVEITVTPTSFLANIQWGERAPLGPF